jgi:hypothetical protein
MPWACHHEKHVYEKCEYKVSDRALEVLNVVVGMDDASEPCTSSEVIASEASSWPWFATGSN